MRTARDIAHEIMTPPVSAKVSAALLGFEGDLEDLLVEAIEKGMAQGWDRGFEDATDAAPEDVGVRIMERPREPVSLGPLTPPIPPARL